MNYKKYQRNYFMPPEPSIEWAKKEYIDRAPVWCSVDLRDGNQSLITPMNLEEKVEFFLLLADIGFKEIEVGFPAASDTEYQFLRTLIENDLIPDDVTVQVLTQAREHIIRRTFEALRGCKKAIVHVYNSTSFAQREQVFKKDKAQIKKIAVDGAKLLKKLAEETEGNFLFEYSPESFTGTEPEYALEVCNAVLDVWQPTADKKAIINLPDTVEMSLPHIYASQVEYMCKNMHYRENVVVSLHPHNDRGCGVADAELGILAGADRIEGTLFGNGERTGNVDVITLGMNLYSHGVDPKLDFSDMNHICEVYERVTRMHVYERQPYCGKLVFAAFSGSHQDAIAKGMAFHKEHKRRIWTVPYLPIDPKDVGRQYETDVIRINSQSGKGGISYILEQNYGFNLPAKMREDLGYAVKRVSDRGHRELKPKEVYDVFMKEYVNRADKLKLVDYHFVRQGEAFKVVLTVKWQGEEHDVTAIGNGRLDAVSNAVIKLTGVNYHLSTYQEHAVTGGSTSQAVSYVGLEADGKTIWGAGVHEDIIAASIVGLFSAFNRI